jgi:hypothetical protein
MKHEVDKHAFMTSTVKLIIINIYGAVLHDPLKEKYNDICFFCCAYLQTTLSYPAIPR